MVNYSHSRTFTIAQKFDSSIFKNNNVLNSNVTVLRSKKDYQKCFKKIYKYCHLMPIECLDCSIDNNSLSPNCIYGQPIKTNCSVKNFTEKTVQCMVIYIINRKII